MTKRLLTLILFVAAVQLGFAQVTTSGISGKVTAGGEEAIGATVRATHQPSGTVYLGVSNASGRFTIDGMRPGGPYTVDISYIGYQDRHFKDIVLELGERTNL